MAEECVFLLRLVGEKKIPKVAEDLKITEGAVRSRLARCRGLIIDANWFTMQVKQLQRNNPRARKFSISASLEEDENI